MKVSIIIPVYNVSEYIERCLTSVFRQTYNDIECIIVDDCTPDDSMLKCERLLSTYKGNIHFKIIHHSKNSGLSAARNSGIDVATGDWLFFLDSDDAILENSIELLVNETKLVDDIDFVVGNTQSIPHEEYYELRCPSYPYRLTSNISICSSFFCQKSLIPVMAWNKLINSSFLKKNSLYFYNGIIHEDELWIVQTVCKAQRISIIQDYTYITYRRENSIITSSSQQKSANNMAIVIYEALKQVSTPFERAKLIYLLRKYFDKYPQINSAPKYFRLALSLFFNLLKYRYFTTAVKFALRTFSNKIVFNLKYQSLPELQNSSIKILSLTNE